ncbi:MAG: ribonuclease HI family protein [Elusimicrobiota bacterium]
MYKLYTDGGCLGNPGQSAAGVVILDSADNEIFKGSVYLGEGTNNTAEYAAVFEGIKIAGNLNIKRLDVFSDSELIIKQLNGQYKVKSVSLKEYKDRIEVLKENFKEIKFRHIRRSHTEEPHNLAEAMLQKRKK